MPEHGIVSGYYVYGVVAAEDIPDEECLGVGGAAVEYVVDGPLAAVVSGLEETEEGSLRADLMAHTSVLEWLAERTTVVPIVFGTIVDDAKTAAESILTPGAELLVDLLESLRGTAQFNLRGIYHRDQVLSEVIRADPTLAELSRRTRDLPPGQPHPELIRLGEGVSGALERQKAEDSQLVLSAVEPYVVDLRERAGGDMDLALNVALLVPAGRRHDVERTLEELAEDQQERLRLQLTGPFPPYDFVEEASWGS